MPTDAFQSAVIAAINSVRPDDVISGVKMAVITELEMLDPSVEIRSTDYFNHSYAPDLVLRWGKKEKREVYLRYSLRSAQAARDVELLGSGEPVFISLDSGNDDDGVEITQEMGAEVSQHPGSLVTNVPAMDSLGPPQAEADEAVAEEFAAAPLMSLFRRNVVRGGRGLIVPGTTGRLQEITSEGTPESEAAYAMEFAAAASEILREDASLQVRRASDLIRVALTGDVNILVEATSMNDDDDSSADELLSGQLSKEEVHALLPYLLRKSRSSINPLFWRYLGSMVTFQQFESMASQLSGLGVADFVRANLVEWRASKSIVSVNADALGEDSPAEPSWTFNANMLCATAGSWRVHFTADKRKGGSRQDSLLANWDDLRPALDAVSLSSIELQGVVRRVKISTDDDSNVIADAGSIQSTIEDDFRVRSIDARTSVDDSSDIRLDFSLMAGTGNNIPLGDLADASFTVLGHRFPITAEERAELMDEVVE